MHSALPVRLQQRQAQRLQAAQCVFGDHKLVGICPPISLYSDGFATPDQLRAAEAEAEERARLRRKEEEAAERRKQEEEAAQKRKEEEE